MEAPSLKTDLEEGLKISTPFGPVMARGTAVFIVIAMFGFAWLELYTNDARSKEHKEIINYLDYSNCLSKLTIYVGRQPREAVIDFSNMPVDLYNCAPRFLTEMRQIPRGKE